jgi:hypothetical protein
VYNGFIATEIETMNERIDQLVKFAAHRILREGDWSLSQQEVERFAELTIQCVLYDVKQEIQKAYSASVADAVIAPVLQAYGVR